MLSYIFIILFYLGVFFLFLFGNFYNSYFNNYNSFYYNNYYYNSQWSLTNRLLLCSNSDTPS